MTESEGTRPGVLLYDDGGEPEADLQGVASYIERVSGIAARVAGDITARLSQNQGPAGATGSPNARDGAVEQVGSIRDVARAFAATRVHNLMRRESFEEPLPAEVDFLARQLSRSGPRRFGYLYDAMAVMSIYRALLPSGDDPSIVFTYQLMATWDEGDLKYHARVMVAGSPSIISIPGVVLAPARPREYYMYQAGARAAGMSDEEIDLKMKETIGDRYVTHGDPRIAEILKGYALQAAAYWILGEAFCEDPDCRLFNAHWQEEMLRAQLGGKYEFCPRHEKILSGNRAQGG